MLDISLGHTLRLFREVAGIDKAMVAMMLREVIQVKKPKITKNSEDELSVEEGLTLFSYDARYIRAQLTAIEANLKLPSEELLHVLAELYECDIYDYIELLCKYEEAKANSPGYTPWHSTKDNLYLGIWRPEKGDPCYYTYNANRAKTKECVLIRTKENLFGKKPAYKEWQYVNLVPGQYQFALFIAMDSNPEFSSYINTALGLGIEQFDAEGYLLYASIADWLQLKLPHILGMHDKKASEKILLPEFFTEEAIKTYGKTFLKKLDGVSLDNFQSLQCIKNILNHSPMRSDKYIAKKLLCKVLSCLPRRILRKENLALIDESTNPHEFGADAVSVHKYKDRNVISKNHFRKKTTENDTKTKPIKQKVDVRKSSTSDNEADLERFREKVRSFTSSISWSDIADEDDVYGDSSESHETVAREVVEDMLPNDDSFAKPTTNINDIEPEVADLIDETEILVTKPISFDTGSVRHEQPEKLNIPVKQKKQKKPSKSRHVPRSILNKAKESFSNQFYVLVKPFGFQNDVDINVDVIVIPKKG